MLRSTVLAVCIAACGFTSVVGVKETADADVGEPADARVSFVIEAEAASSTTMPTVHRWTR
jgi:hypothetical protein